MTMPLLSTPKTLMPSPLAIIVSVLVMHAVKSTGCSARAAGIARREPNEARATHRMVF